MLTKYVTVVWFHSGPKTRCFSFKRSVVGGVLYGWCMPKEMATLFMYGQTVGPILKQDNVTTWCDSCSAETLENQWVSSKVNPRVSFKKKMNRIFTHCYRLFACPNVWWSNPMPSTRLWILSWISCPARIWTRRASNTGGSWNWVIHGGNVRKRANRIKTTCTNNTHQCVIPHEFKRLPSP